LTGRPPFKGATLWETLTQVRTQEPVPPSRLCARVPRDLETICLKGLQKDPRHRYATAAELAEELRRYLDGVPIRTRRVSLLEHTWRWCRRKPAQAALVALLSLVLLVTPPAILWYLFSVGAAQQSADEAKLREEAAREKAKL